MNFTGDAALIVPTFLPERNGGHNATGIRRKMATVRSRGTAWIGSTPPIGTCGAAQGLSLEARHGTSRDCRSVALGSRTRISSCRAKLIRGNERGVSLCLISRAREVRDLKTGVPARGPRVRIPPSRPTYLLLESIGHVPPQSTNWNIIDSTRLRRWPPESATGASGIPGAVQG